MSAWGVVASVAGLGALGALLRYLSTLGWERRGGRASVAIALVNTLGCLAMGILGAWTGWSGGALVAAALVGSFTTLSSLSVDVAEQARAGRWREATQLLAFHVIGGFSGFALGHLLGLALVG